MPRALEVLIAGFGLVLVSPLLLLIWIWVRFGLGAPVLFVQQRSGHAGRSFALVKFRSMTDQRDAAGQLLPDTARTPIMGRLLRRSRLDELPELWNILKGEMAIVGPRPLLVATVTALGEQGERRGQVRPGLTGWAQVNGNALLPRDAKVSLDLWYIDHRSFWLDIKIIFRTVLVIVQGEKINFESLERACAGNNHRGR
jgi:lipopolysaccharide/colanic/teichoic acid biosynthesis glycosyltransferase